MATPMRARPAIAAPTPMPAFAPVDRPLEESVFAEVGDEVAGAVEVVFVTLPLVLAAVELLVAPGIS